MLFHFIAIFALFSNNVFTAAQTQSSCRIPSVGEDEECGTLSVVTDTPLAGGRAALREEMRWQAGVYTKSTQPYMQVCAGSLVSSKVVISAAHCFWSETKQLPASEFAVALGKLYRPWNDPGDENAQKSDIRDIRIPPRYHGSITNYQDDIALLVLSTPIEINSYILPVCLDFDYALDSKQLADGNLGKVAGWDRPDENGKPSPTLQVVNLPAVDIKRCYDTIEPTFKPALTSDKICAGRTMEGTVVCMGDSGGGLTFPENSTDGEKFYLRGVVSTAPKSVNDNLCNIYTYATFTHITKHEQFIREVMSEASKPAPELQVTTLSIIDPDAPPIPDISSLPLPSEPGLFRPLGEVIAGGRPKPLNKRKNKKKDKKDSIKTGTTDSGQSEETQDTEVNGVNKTERAQNKDNVTEISPSKSEDTGADFTIQIVEDPSTTQTRPSQNDTVDDVSQTKPRNDQAYVDHTVKIIEEPTETKPLKSQTDTDVEAEFTIQIVDEPTTQTTPSILNKIISLINNNDAVTQTKPSKQTDIDADADTVKIDEEPTVTQTKPSTSQVNSDPSKPQDEDAVSEYTVQIIEEPIVTTDSTKTDQYTEKRPFLSISSEPFLSTGTKSTQTDTFIDNQQILPIGIQPDKTIDDQSDESIGVQPIQSKPISTIDNQPDKSIGNHPIKSEDELNESTDNQSNESIGVQPIQSKPISSIDNQPDKFIGNPIKTADELNESTDNHSDESIGVQPIQSKPISAIDNQPDKSIGHHPIKSADELNESIDDQLIQSAGNQPDQSIENQSSQSIGKPSQTLNQAAQSWNQLPLSVWNQPTSTVANQLPLYTGSQPAQATETQLPQTTGHLSSTSNQAQIIVTKPIKPFGNQLPGQFTDNQPTQSGNQKPENQEPLPPWKNPVQSSNQRVQTTGNPSVLYIGNQPVKSTEQSQIVTLGVIGSQQSAGQSTGNQAFQSGNQNSENQQPLPPWNNPVQLSNQRVQTTGNPSVLSIENQSVKSTEQSQIEAFGVIGSQQSTDNQAFQFEYQKAQPGNQVPLSPWNNPVQSSNQRVHTTGNPSVISTGNQPVKSVEQSGVALGVTGNQESVYFVQSTPSSYTTHKNPDVAFVNHRWNSNSGFHHQYPYDFSHDHYHHNHDHYHGHHNHDHYHGHHNTDHYHGHGHHDTGHYHDYHHQKPHYHNHHDWHNYNNQW